MRSDWRTIGITFVALLTVGAGLWHERPFDERRFLGDGQPLLPRMTLRGAPGGELQVEIADETEERMNGLSRRNGLGPNRGMVFLFEKAAIYPFWMKDMRFPIDIVYLREGLVTQVFASVPPPGPGELPTTVEPTGFVDAVLELSSGEAVRRGIVPGSYFQGLPSLR